MTQQKRGRGRPRNDGQPNKSTTALLLSGAEVQPANPVLGKYTKPEPKSVPVNRPKPISPVANRGDRDEAAIGLNQAQRIEDAFRQEAELPVYNDRDAPEGLKTVDIKKPVSVTISDFMKSLYK